jgi:predicted transcriptional regulator of viral defense system
MSVNPSRSLSPLEAKLVLELEWQDRHVVDRGEVVCILGTPARADPVIRSLLKKRWLERIAAGRYLLLPAERGPEGIPDANLLRVAKHLVEPYYVGYATAAQHHRLTTQSRTTIWIVTPKVVRDRHIRGVRFRFASVVARKFFGYASTKALGEEVIMSDPEKTVLDCVDKVGNAGGIGEVAGIVSRLATKFDWAKFCDYAGRLDSVAAVQRFGYLADRTGLRIPADARQRLRGQVKPHSRSYLGPTAKWGKEATYDAEWRILANVPEREIRAEI